MATQIADLFVALDVQTKALKDAGQQLEQFGSKVDRLQKSVDRLSGKIEKGYQRQASAAKKSASAQANAVDKSKAAMDKQRVAVRRLDAQYEKQRQQLRKLQRAGVDTSQAQARLARSYKNATKTLGEQVVTAQRAQQVQNKFRSTLLGVQNQYAGMAQTINRSKSFPRIVELSSAASKSMGRYNLSIREASRRQQGFGSVLKKSSSITGRYRKQVEETHKAQNTWIQRFDDFARTVRGIEGPLGGTAARLQTLAGVLKSGRIAAVAFTGAIAGSAVALGAFTTVAVRVQLEIERVKSTLRVASESAQAAEASFDFLRNTTRELGVDFQASANGFAQFKASAMAAGFSVEEIREIFVGVSEASRALGLNAQDTTGILRAFSQVASKGTVQAEELRGQIGERLPGAFSMAADTLGVTTAELNKMLEQGEVLAEDLLPKFGKRLSETFGPQAARNADNLRGTLNTFRNELAFAIKNIDDAIGASEDFSDALSAVNDALKWFNDTIDQEDPYGTIVDGSNRAIGAIQELRGWIEWLQGAWPSPLDVGPGLVNRGLGMAQEQFGPSQRVPPKMPAEIKRVRNETKKTTEEVEKLSTALAGLSKDPRESIRGLVKNLQDAQTRMENLQIGGELMMQAANAYIEGRDAVAKYRDALKSSELSQEQQAQVTEKLRKRLRELGFEGSNLEEQVSRLIAKTQTYNEKQERGQQFIERAKEAVKEQRTALETYSAEIDKITRMSDEWNLSLEQETALLKDVTKQYRDAAGAVEDYFTRRNTKSNQLAQMRGDEIKSATSDLSSLFGDQATDKEKAQKRIRELNKLRDTVKGLTDAAVEMNTPFRNVGHALQFISRASAEMQKELNNNIKYLDLNSDAARDTANSYDDLFRRMKKIDEFEVSGPSLQTENLQAAQKAALGARTDREKNQAEFERTRAQFDLVMSANRAQLAEAGIQDKFATAERLSRKMQDLQDQIDGTAQTMDYLEQAFDSSFNRIGSAITEAFVKGEDAAVSFQSVARGVISEIIQMMIQLAAIQPLKQALGFQTSGPTASSVIGLIGTGVGTLFAGAGAATPQATASFGNVAATQAATGYSTTGAMTATMGSFAEGGSFEIGGRSGRDKNVMSINNKPVANVSKGEMVTVTPSNVGAGGGGVYAPTVNIEINNSQPMSDKQSEQQAKQVSAEMRRALREEQAKFIREQQRPGNMLNPSSARKVQ